MLNLRFFDPAQLEKNLKVTIHKTGKMGFTIDAAKKLDLSVDKSAEIAVNADDASDKNLYLLINNDRNGHFKISKAGDYYYINTKVLFDNLKIDYVKEYVVYDMSETELNGRKLYILKRRMKPKKETENDK